MARADVQGSLFHPPPTPNSFGLHCPGGCLCLSRDLLRRTRTVLGIAFEQGHARSTLQTITAPPSTDPKGSNAVSTTFNWPPSPREPCLLWCLFNHAPSPVGSREKALKSRATLSSTNWLLRQDGTETSLKGRKKGRLWKEGGPKPPSTSPFLSGASDMVGRRG